MHRLELILIISTLVSSGVPALAQRQQAPPPIQQQAQQAAPQSAPATSQGPLSAAPQNIDRDAHFKGPNPGVDITRYGARAVATNTAPAIPGITANINSSSNSATISNASTFLNGDGVTIFGAGAACSLSMPTGVTVTPSLAAAGTGTGIVANAPSGGATTYNYQVIARNKAGCLTAASAVGSTAVGQAALGSKSVAITSIAKSGTTNTVTTSSAHGLAVNSMVEVFQTSDDINFGGYFVVLTVPDNTHFTYTNNFDTANGSPASAIGGKAKWYNCNRVAWNAVTGAWAYYIYGRTGGSLTYLGMSKPGQLFWDDFGSPMMDNVVAPYFVPNTPPVAALSNPLVTTISSGGGTITLKLANAAGTSVAVATILFDNTPAIQAAAAAQASTGGTIYIPVGTFVVNSYLTIPGPSAVSLGGGLFANDTIDTSSASRWFGNLSPQRSGAPSFGFEGLNNISAGKAPILMFSDAASSSVFRGIGLLAAPNGIGMLLNGANQTTWEYMNFIPGGSGVNDYMSQGLVLIGITDIFFNHMHDITMTAAQGNDTKTPVLFADCSGAMRIDHLSLTARGLGFGSVANLDINHGRMQGANMPFLTLGGVAPGFCPGGAGNSDVGPTSVRNYELDTAPEPLVVNLFWNGAIPPDTLVVENAGVPSAALPNVAGVPFFNTLGIGDVGSIGNARATILSGAGISSSHTGTLIAASGSSQVSYQMPTVSAPAVAVNAGGAFPVGTFRYTASVVDALGNESTPGLSTLFTTTNGNQSLSVTPPVQSGGAVGWRPYVCTSGGGSCTLRTVTPCSTGTLAFTANFTDAVASGCGNSAPTVNLASQASLSSSGLLGYKTVLSPTLFANLGTPANGNFVYCSDCNVATDPCTSGGTGALAQRLNGRWRCQ